MIDLDRLRHLSALGDTQAAEELQRQESRRGDVIPSLLSQLRAAFDQGDFNTARVKVFGLHCAGYDQLRWRIGHGVVISPESDVDLITGKHGRRDHFKVCSSGGGGMGFIGYNENVTLTARRVAFPHRDGLASIPLLWNQAILDMARAELARYAQHWGRLLVASPQWAEFAAANPTEPGVKIANPTATLSQLRALATAARIYTRHALDGITEGEGRAARQDMARMLAALYCGCDYRITPEVSQ